MNSVKLKQPVSIYNDPWESYNDVKEHGQLTLSNINLQQQIFVICVVATVQLVILYKLSTPSL